MAKHGPEYIGSNSKRSLDIAGGLALAAALLPVGTLGAVASAIDTRESPLFRQRRLGKNLDPFDIIKLRTLRGVDAAADAITAIHGTHDPRASKVGMALRASAIDEAPQILNVLMGHMSLVGIRPRLDTELVKMQDIKPKLFNHWYAAYALCPGLTGPDQMRTKQYRECTDDVYIEAMELGLEYVENASLIGDLAIMARTPSSLLTAYLWPIDNRQESALAA